MVLLNHGETKAVAGAARNGQRSKLARVRLAREIFEGRYLHGESVQLSEIAAKYQLDGDSVQTIFAELQTVGMVTLSESLRRSSTPRTQKRCKKPMRYGPLWKKLLDGLRPKL